MATRRAELDDDLPGRNSVMDIAANVVGILVLFVMIIGAKTAVMGRQTAPAVAPAPIQPVITTAEVADAEHEFVRSRDTVIDTVRRAADLRERNKFRLAERQVLADHNVTFEQEIADRRGRLTEGEQRDYDMRVKLAAAQDDLDRLSREQIALASTVTESDELKVRPTPIARAVTEDELMLRLKGDRLSVVPIDELIDQLKQQDLQQLGRRAGTEMGKGIIGPVGGYRLHFKAMEEELTLPNGMTATRAFLYMEFKSVTADVGEPIAQAMESGSELDRALQTNNPRRTVVTLWIYPDSFEHCNSLREKLYERGYSVAVRPLPAWAEIAAGPQGSKSVAQ